MRRTPVFLLLALGIASLIPAPAVAGGGGPHCAPKVSDQKTNVVTMSKSCFHPTVARVDVDEEVTFVSEDPVPHTVTGALFVFGDTEDMREGDTRTFRFDEEGIYPYVCILHPGMVGAIVVGDGKGPGDGAVAETSTYVAPTDQTNSAATDKTGSATETRAAAATDGSQWPLAVALIVVLAVAGFVGTRREREAM